MTSQIPMQLAQRYDLRTYTPLQVYTYATKRREFFFKWHYLNLLWSGRRNHTKTDTYLISNLHFSQVIDDLLSFYTMYTCRDHINKQHFTGHFLFKTLILWTYSIWSYITLTIVMPFVESIKTQLYLSIKN